MLATVRNQGLIVDTFDLRVDGLPESWWTISPATVFLNPWGSSGDYEQQVQVRLHPPRTPEAQARDWPLTVVARSRSHHADVATAPATLTVQPFQSTVMRVGPERRRGRRHASFDVAVANHGNSPMEIVIRAKDSEDRCPVTVASQRATVPMGESAGAVVRVRVPRPLIFGRPIDHQLDITHHATGVESDPAPQRVTFRQRSWLPWWLPPVLGLIAAFGVALLLLSRDPVVPKLEGDTRRGGEGGVGQEASQARPHGLRRRGRGHPGRDDHPPGARGGRRLVKGESVDITLAAKPQARLVPRLSGRTLAEAAGMLDGAHFAAHAQPPSAGDDGSSSARTRPRGPSTGSGRRSRSRSRLPPPPRRRRRRRQTPTPTATPASAAGPKPAKKAAAEKKSAGAKVAKKVALPKDFVFAGATSGQLYRWVTADAKAARLTSPRYWLETPTKTTTVTSPSTSSTTPAGSSSTFSPATRGPIRGAATWRRRATRRSAPARSNRRPALRGKWRSHT